MLCRKKTVQKLYKWVVITTVVFQEYPKLNKYCECKSVATTEKFCNCRTSLSYINLSFLYSSTVNTPVFSVCLHVFSLLHAVL